MWNTSAPSQGPVVLLVEDDSDLREMTTQMLEIRGFHVLAANDAVSAITTCRVFDSTIDVLLTDLGLPDIPGDLVIRHVVATARRRPWVVVVTGYDEPFISRARQAGADVVLTKPLAWSALLDRLLPEPAAPLAA
jgi:DNA-binding response OmpR family regulator